MRIRHGALLVGAVTLVAAIAGCSGSVQRPGTATSAARAPSPSESAASPRSAPSVTPTTDLSGFDVQFTTAVATVAKVPLAGLSPGETVTPVCQSVGEPASAARVCIAAFPAADPVVTMWANATGSMGSTGMMMAAAAMPDGIKGTVLPAPKLGDTAVLSRSWGPRGCTAVLAVRDGTLIVSVQVRLAPGATTSDCGIDPPSDYLETTARALLDNLVAFRAVGLPVDDAVGRNRAVKLITDGTLRPGDRDLITLPSEFASLSDSGEVIAMHDGKDWTIVFFEVRGMVDHYSGWVFRSSGKLGADEDPLQGGGATVVRIDDHWFHVVAS
jgi:hypothetical protein